MKIIISRHPAAIEFIRRQPGWEDAPVLASATAEDVHGREVAGNLPLHLAARAQEVWAVEFDGPAPRGREYGLPEMEAAGAKLRRYVVLSDDRVAEVLETAHIGGYSAPEGLL